ncbi:histidine phosphatase family protein [Paenibacillus sp. A3M_27_13]|uniref:histidine phosphatase family protein n=1 Tax=Paenibacillus sp. A3M_27_13 TaxID=2962029 RepID=UPI00265E7C31|nr:histidine phosphatase family protein [Paenibacillus sp. A3M_27_13]
MSTIYLIRHGQSEANHRGVMESRLDSPLDALGKRQTALIAERLRGVNLQCIYTSPSLRATMTADMIRGQRGTALVHDESLYEMDIGLWDGLTPLQAEQSNPALFKQFRQHPESFRPEEGESFFDVQNRAIRLLSRILTDRTTESILIVSHSVVLKLMMCHFKEETIRNVWDAPQAQNASLSLVHVHNQNEYFVELEADVSHLKQMTMI